MSWKTSILTKAALMLSLAAGSACGGCGDKNNDPMVPVQGSNNAQVDMGNGTSVFPDVGPDPDTGEDVGPPPTDPVGQLNLTVWQSDALYDYPEVYAQAVFSPELATSGVVNPVGWLANSNGWDVFLPDDFWPIPASGMPVTDASTSIDGITFLDAGVFVGSGVDLNANLDEELQSSQGAFVYTSAVEDAATLAEEEDLTVPLSVFVDGGADIGAAELPDAFAMTQPIELTSHDPSVELPIRYGEDVVIDWTPSAETDDFIVVGLETFDGASYWRFADEDGSANVTSLAAEASLRLQDEPTVVLSRVREQDVQLAEGVLQVVTQHKLWLYGKAAAPYDVEPKVWPVGETTPVTVRWWDGNFADATVGAGTEVTIENARISDSEGNVLQFDVTLDEGATTGAVDITAGPLALEDAAWVAAPLPQAGDCASAVDEGFAADGTYFGTDEGLEAAWFFGTEYCPLMDPEGREQVVPIHLNQGEALTASLVRPDLNGVLYLATDCDAVDDVTDCTMAPRKDRAATLQYVAEVDEDLLLVIDGYTSSDAPAASYVIDIRTTGPAPFTFSPRTATDGGSETLSVVSFVGDFDGTSTFDLGADVTVDGVQLFGDFALVDITAGDGTGSVADWTPDVTINVGGMDYTLSDAFTIRPWIGANDSCAAADAAGALAPGAYEGLSLIGGFDAVTPVPCLSENADGMEAIFRVDLGASETLRAHVSMPGRDPVIYVLDTCGGEVLACTDDRASGDEYVEWTGSAAPSTVYLVVDGFGVDDSDVFFLDVEVSL